MTPAEGLGPAPAWEGGVVFPCGCGPGGLWAESPGVLTNVDGVLGRPRLAVARGPSQGLVPGAAWEAGPHQPEPSGQISFLPGPAVKGRETPPGRGGGVPRVDLVEPASGKG